MKRGKLNQGDAECLRRWWHSLDDNRGDRAQLRRAQSPDDILLTPAFAHFLQVLPKPWIEDVPLSDLAMVAAVLARVKTDISDERATLAKSLATPKEGGSKAAMSELRFQQLQKSRTPQDFFTRLCRAIQLLGSRANVVLLTEDILLWLTEFRYGPSSKPQQRLAVRWASDYYMQIKD
jgi:CRISPR system Cascade subunit CasB